MIKILLSSLLLFSSSVTLAEEPIEHEFFDKFIKENEEFEHSLNLKIERVFRLTHLNCVSSLKIERQKPSIISMPIERPTFKDADPDTMRKKDTIIENRIVKKDTAINDDDKNAPSPAYGQWIEHNIVTGCGETTRVNSLVVAYSDLMPLIYPLLSGKTALDPIDQPFAEQSLMTRLKKLERPCEGTPFVSNTDLVGYRIKSGKAISQEDTGYGRFERWDITACDTKYSANIAILPDPKKRYRYIARLKKK
ncbi:MAG: hypothetical protein COB76_05970 [Alphaproteobacteria bacterium]|nr:MAG: hypothetical protein COB76_05970 [Alphaproteobacteria bacterium]